MSRDKTFNEMQNVGTAKYVVNYHDGAKTHNDGSAFYDVRIFKNRKDKDAFVRRLVAKGWKAQ